MKVVMQEARYMPDLKKQMLPATPNKSQGKKSKQRIGKQLLRELKYLLDNLLSWLV